MLGYRPRHWPKIDPTLDQCLVFSVPSPHPSSFRGDPVPPPPPRAPVQLSSELQHTHHKIITDVFQLGPD